MKGDFREITDEYRTLAAGLAAEGVLPKHLPKAIWENTDEEIPLWLAEAIAQEFEASHE